MPWDEMRWQIGRQLWCRQRRLLAGWKRVFHRKEKYIYIHIVHRVAEDVAAGKREREQKRQTVRAKHAEEREVR